MNEYSFLIPILFALILGVISPGPSFFVVSQTAMNNSRKEAIYISFGLALGAAVLAFFASFGLYILIKKAPFIYLIFKIIGGLYLCYLSFIMYKNINKTKEYIKNVESNTYKKAFFKGLLVQLSNPKTIIILAGIFAAFLPSNIPAFTYLILFILVFLLDALWYISVSYLLSTKKAQNAFFKYKKSITLISCSFLLFMGFKLILVI